MPARAPSAAPDLALDPAHVTRAQATLLDWFARHSRDLPWRHTRDPYAVLVSEVMLQQTQVDRVRPRWAAWLERFPTLADLAVASPAEVLRAWSGLGYNLRALRLHVTAQRAVAEHGGRLPDTLTPLLDLPGLGRYTAAAIACFALGLPVAVVDTNVRRVLGRVFLGEPDLPVGRQRAAERLAEAVLARQDPWAWNQALMDLGATICTAARPACLVCPLVRECRAAPFMGAWQAERGRRLREARAAYQADELGAHNRGRDHAARQRVLRGRIVAALAALPPGASTPLADLAEAIKASMPDVDRTWVDTVARRLSEEGLVVLEGPPDAPAVRLP